MAISMLKIRRPLGRLIFNMGIAIPGKTVFLIETAPRVQSMVTKIEPSFPGVQLYDKEGLVIVLVSLASEGMPYDSQH